MDLTPAQAATLRDAIRHRLNYLHAVKVRMFQVGVGPGDRQYDLFDQAEGSLRRLADELHGLPVVRERRPWEPGGAGHGP